jgi:hypothetical protein
MVAALAACACAAVPRAGAAQALTPGSEPSVGALVRVFTDSDEVRVRSLMGDGSVPLGGRATLALHWNHERVVIPGVAAPAGSAEAVDAITTASRPIAGDAFRDYVKLRDEVQGTLTRGPATFDGYVSSERDYLARQLGARIDREFPARQLSVSFGGSLAWDDIRPLADDDTRTAADRKTTLHLNAVATRVLSAATMVRVGAELNRVEGLQHNPYRNVYAGGTRVPERHPDERLRGDVFVRVHHALPARASLKLAWRGYDDDWGIASHELDTRLSQYITSGLSARYGYRWYTQTAADFHRDEYAGVDGIDGYRTGDYRMGALSSHLFGVTVDADLDGLAAVHPLLRRMSVRVSIERYFNSNNYSADILEAGLGFELP